MPAVTITIPGNPVAQGRPRAARWRAKDGRTGVSLRDPAKSRDWKGRAQIHMLEELSSCGFLPPLHGAGVPVFLRVEVFFPCPVSDYRKREPRPQRPHTKRGDLGNVLKAVEDAGTGVLWLDDAQIHRIEASKWIAAQGAPGRVVLMVDDQP